jgi:hypothetical protein
VDPAGVESVCEAGRPAAHPSRPLCRPFPPGQRCQLGQSPELAAVRLAEGLRGLSEDGEPPAPRLLLRSLLPSRQRGAPALNLGPDGPRATGARVPMR